MNKWTFKLNKFYHYIFGEKFFKKINFDWDKYPSRFEILQKIILRKNYKSYLEIGCDKNLLFSKISIDNKIGIDPKQGGTIRITSDDFFKINNKKFDIIFIDGLHTADQVEKDILNSINHLSEKGTIVLHDCNPPTEDHARAEYYNFNTPAGGIWNGTVWKSIYKFRSLRPDLHVCVADCDWGVGIIRRGQQKLSEFNNPYYEYSVFSKNRKEHLNLISPSDVDKWIISPFYP